MNRRTGGVPPAVPGACLAFLWLGLLAGCASQGAPTGGPEDKDPPDIVATNPSPGALNVREAKIAIEFSEYVDRRSFQESAFLSPSAGTLVFEWDGTTVEVSAPETLRANTTYILTVGTDLKDTRNNKRGESFTLPFSTGGAIDSCSVAGRVDDADPAGVMVFAFDIAGGRGDTLDPARVRPDYLTQAGKEGGFLLRNMRAGEYRLVAVRDAFKNLLYNAQTDQYGMASSDVRVGGDARAIEGVGFRLTTQDTLRPFLSGAKAPTSLSLGLRFNEPVAIPGGAASITIADTAGGRSVPVLGVVASDTSGREFLVLTAPQDSGAVYRVAVGEFLDARGNRADSAGKSAVFAGGSGRDTLPPALTLSVLRDSATGFLPLDTLVCTFNEPVDTAAFAASFSLKGTGGAAVPGGLRWSGSAFARFVAAAPFTPGAWYTLSVRLDSVRGLTGMRGPDSLVVRRFRIAEEKMLAGISGRVVAGAQGTGRPGATIVVEGRNVSGAGPKGLRARADSAGSFRLEPLPEGRYVLSAFIDWNGNGVHDCGTPFPVVFAEPFGLLGDTLRLRPGWPVEGVRIDIGR